MIDIADLIVAVTEYFGSDKKRIHHFLKVYAFAETIGEREGLEAESLELLKTAAVVHDVGIKPAEAKYGSADGRYQELEGPAEAKKLLRGFDCTEKFIENVCFLVGHHHSYGSIATPEHQILVEADLLVNFYEDGASESAVKSANDKIFRTQTGKNLLKIMFSDN